MSYPVPYCHVLMYYVLSCRILYCSPLPTCGLSHSVLSCRVLSDHTPSCPVLPTPFVSVVVFSCPHPNCFVQYTGVMLYVTPLCRALSYICRILSSRVLSSPVLACPVLSGLDLCCPSFPVLPCRVLSCPLGSCPQLSCPVLPLSGVSSCRVLRITRCSVESCQPWPVLSFLPDPDAF